MIIAICIAAGVLAAAGVTALLVYYYALPGIVVRRLRKADNPDGAMTYPPDYEALAARVRTVKNLTYPSAYPSNEYDLYLPTEGEKSYPLIVWIHGGGFIGGTKDGGENVMTALSAAGYAVASINYAVAPEHHYPVAVRQINEFCSHLPALAQAYPEADISRLVFGGDSAGAQLAAQYLTVLTSPALAADMKLTPAIKESSLRAAALVCGPFDLPGIRAFAARTNKKFRLVVDLWGRAYYGKVRWYKSAAARETVVPNYVTAAFPPAFLTDGNKGSFEAQNRRLAACLREKGVEAEELYFDPKDYGDVPHEYLFHLADETSRQCMERMIDFLDRQTKK